jgi:transposase-like protein
MDPQQRFCHNRGCWAYGRAGEGHIVIHSQKEHRYKCKRCKKTFSETKGTAFYRAHKPHELLVTVVTLLAYGCPVQAIVAAFALDERTIHRWQHESGRQCQRVHQHIVQAGGVSLAQVQADELRVRIVGGVMWLASAISVTSRLWLGGVLQIQRDRGLIRTLLEHVRACGASFEALLLCTDGFSSYPKQALKVLRKPLRTGKPGRPRLLLPEGLMVAQAIKRYSRRRVSGVVRRVIRGTEEAVKARLSSTQGDSRGAVINTAYIERLQATLRSRLAALARRTRAAVHKQASLEAGMWLVGSVYNFCCWHRSLRFRCSSSSSSSRAERRWVERTPAQAAGLADHRWSVHELLTFSIPPTPPKRRGRRPRWLLEATHAA